MLQQPDYSGAGQESPIKSDSTSGHKYFVRPTFERQASQGFSSLLGFAT